jgi:hypothetical protein
MVFPVYPHTIPLDWMLPGIPPTGKRVKVEMVVVAQFDDDKLAHVALVLGQASPLVPLGRPAGDLPGHKGRGDTISARSKHTAKWTNSPRQGNGAEDGCLHLKRRPALPL